MKILVVEDEPLIRLGLATAIEEAGYDVLEAAGATEKWKTNSIGGELRPELQSCIFSAQLTGSCPVASCPQRVKTRRPPASSPLSASRQPPVSLDIVANS